jgi:hypothetical protein
MAATVRRNMTSMMGDPRGLDNTITGSSALQEGVGVSRSAMLGWSRGCLGRAGIEEDGGGEVQVFARIWLVPTILTLQTVAKSSHDRFRSGGHCGSGRRCGIVDTLARRLVD